MLIIVQLQLLIVLFFLFVTIYITKLKFKKILNPISLILFWWGGWLLLAIDSPIGLHKLNTLTILYALLFLASILVGSLLVEKNSINVGATSSFSMNNKTISLILIIFALPVFYGFLINFGKMLNPVEYSILVRGKNGLFRRVFGSDFIGNFITMFSMSVIFASLVIGAQQKIIFKFNFLVIFSIASLVIYSLVSLERFGLVMTIYVVILTKLCTYWQGNRLLSKGFVFLIVTIFALVIISSFNRTGGGSLVTLLNKYLVMYHTVGFTIFDIHLLQNYTPLNGDIYFGTLNLGFFDRLLSIVTKMFMENPYLSSTLELNMKLSEFLVVGYDDDGLPIKANAFSTALLPLILDGGFIFLIFTGLLLGYLITNYYYKMVLSTNINTSFQARVMLVFFLYASLASIYQGIFSSQFFWGSMMFYWVLTKKYSWKVQ